MTIAVFSDVASFSRTFSTMSKGRSIDHEIESNRGKESAVNLRIAVLYTERSWIFRGFDYCFGSATEVPTGCCKITSRAVTKPKAVVKKLVVRPVI
jgi:hypothetical protein